MRVRNRSGNVHDRKGSLPFLRDLFAQVERFLGRQLKIEMRLDGAVFRSEIAAWLRSRPEDAIKVPSSPRLGLTPPIQRPRRWTRVAPHPGAFAAKASAPIWTNLGAGAA